MMGPVGSTNPWPNVKVNVARPSKTGMMSDYFTSSGDGEAPILSEFAKGDQV